jgi:serine-type D-Ala-D-Ala carboxypeptidase/endopeptidase
MKPLIPMMLALVAHGAIEEVRVREILTLREKKVKAAIVGFIDEGGPRWVAHGSPYLNGDSLFEIGSVTKAFTGILLAEMIERGEVALDDPVAKYLPESVKLPVYNGKPITLGSLVTQSSGLPRLPPNLKPADAENPYADYRVDQLYEGLAAVKLTVEPFQRYEYSNFGTGLLGHVLARRAGKSYYELLRERVLKPLAMNDTVIELSADQRERLIPGYTAGLQPAKNWDLPTLAAAGALRSTANDMLKLLSASLGLRPVDSPTLVKALARAPEALLPAGSETLEIGMAWHIVSRRGPRIVWHNGGTGGYRAWCGFVPETKTAVVVLANTALPMDDVGLHLLNNTFRLVDHRPNNVRRELLLEQDVLLKRTGRYRVNPGLVITVTLEEGRLHAQATGQGKIRLYAESPDRFFARDVEIQIEFGGNGLVLRGSGGAVTAERVP